jgi:hypothetical protein
MWTLEAPLMPAPDSAIACIISAASVLEVLYAASIPDMVFPTSGIPAI